MPTLSTVDASKVNRAFTKVNANYWCSQERRRCEYRETQIAAIHKVVRRHPEFFRVLHNRMHSNVAHRKVMKENQIIVLTTERDRRIVQMKGK